jgi:hypothetical protein
MGLDPSTKENLFIYAKLRRQEEFDDQYYNPREAREIVKELSHELKELKKELRDMSSKERFGYMQEMLVKARKRCEWRIELGHYAESRRKDEFGDLKEYVDVGSHDCKRIEADLAREISDVEDKLLRLPTEHRLPAIRYVRNAEGYGKIPVKSWDQPGETIKDYAVLHNLRLVEKPIVVKRGSTSKPLDNKDEREKMLQQVIGKIQRISNHHSIPNRIIEEMKKDVEMAYQKNGDFYNAYVSVLTERFHLPEDAARKFIDGNIEIDRNTGDIMLEDGFVLNDAFNYR